MMQTYSNFKRNNSIIMMNDNSNDGLSFLLIKYGCLRQCFRDIGSKLSYTLVIKSRYI